MWGIALFFLMIVAGSSEASPDCSLHSYLNCKVDELPEHFPGNKKELYRSCKLETKFLKCVLRVEKRCQADPVFITAHEHLLNATEDLCNKDSPNHQDILNSLSCVKPVFDDPPLACINSYPGHPNMKKYSRALRHKNIPAFTENKRDRKECLKGLYVFYCQATLVYRQCSWDTMEDFIKIIHTRVIPLTESCDPRIKDHLVDIVKIFKSSDEDDDFEFIREMHEDE